VKSQLFQNSVLGLIVLAALLVGVETYPALAERHRTLFDLLNAIILWAFVVEAALKMLQHGTRFWRYFYDPWNVFDFVIVSICFLPINAQYAAVLRLARVVRTLRLVTALPRLQLLVNALLKSIPSMGYIGLLLGMAFYVYGVLGVFLFRENDPVHFRDLQTSMLSMFRVATLEDWTDVMYIQMYGSDRYAYDNHSGVTATSQAQPVLGAVFFVSFVMFVTMIMMNLFIGVILNSMNEVHADREESRREAAEEEAEIAEAAQAELAGIARAEDLGNSRQTPPLPLGTIEIQLADGEVLRCALIPVDEATEPDGERRRSPALADRL